MTRIYQVEEMTGERTFESTSNGVPSEVKVIGMKLTDGKNTLYAEAYRERAEQVKKLNLKDQKTEPAEGRHRSAAIEHKR